MSKERKHYTAEEKVAILRRHLLDKVPVSDLCEELGLRPTVFYRWQKEFFENGAAAPKRVFRRRWPLYLLLFVTLPLQFLRRRKPDNLPSDADMVRICGSV